jgi:hypothetical protein
MNKIVIILTISSVLEGKKKQDAPLSFTAGDW